MNVSCQKARGGSTGPYALFAGLVHRPMYILVNIGVKHYAGLARTLSSRAAVTSLVQC